MKCKKHPQYKAIRKPRVDCPECWAMYREKHKHYPPMESWPELDNDEAARYIGPEPWAQEKK